MHFGHAAHIIDWYHAEKHLWEAAQLLHGSDSFQADAFVKLRKDNLHHGGVGRNAPAILAAIPSASRESFQYVAIYFTINRARMHYQHFQHTQLPTGSGRIETVKTGCKQFKARFAAGMRWSRNSHLLHAFSGRTVEPVVRCALDYLKYILLFTNS